MDEQSKQRWLLLSFAGALLLLLTQIAAQQIADPDLWGRLSVAALFFKNNFHFPYTDPFSFTFLNQPWIDHEWLSGFIFYGVMSIAGETGLLLLKYLLVAGVLWLVFLLHRQVYKKSPMYALYGSILFSPVLAFGYLSTLRCQSFSFLFFALMICGLELVRLQKNNNVLKTLIFFIWIWSALHGGFALGLVLMALYIIGDWIENRKLSRTPYLIPLLVSLVLVAFINPYGLAYLQFLGKALTMARLHVGEWEPLPLWDAQFLETKLLVLLSVILVIVELIRTRRFTTPMLVLAFAIALTLKAIRMQPFLAITMLAYLPLFWHWALPQRFQNVTARLGPVLCAISGILALGFVHFYQPVFKTPIPDENDILAGFHYPVSAIRYLRESGLSGNLMTPFPVGEFTYWGLYPKFRISIDGRFEEVYSVKHFMEQYRFYKQSWPEAAQYASHAKADFILAHQGFANQELFNKHPDWQLIYNDFSFVVFARKKALPETLPAVSKPELVSHTIGDFFTPADRARFKTPANPPQ